MLGVSITYTHHFIRALPKHIQKYHTAFQWIFQFITKDISFNTLFQCYKQLVVVMCCHLVVKQGTDQKKDRHDHMKPRLTRP